MLFISRLLDLLKLEIGARAVLQLGLLCHELLFTLEISCIHCLHVNISHKISGQNYSCGENTHYLSL